MGDTLLAALAVVYAGEGIVGGLLQQMGLGVDLLGDINEYADDGVPAVAGDRPAADVMHPEIGAVLLAHPVLNLILIPRGGRCWSALLMSSRSSGWMQLMI